MPQSTSGSYREIVTNSSPIKGSRAYHNDVNISQNSLDVSSKLYMHMRALASMHAHVLQRVSCMTVHATCGTCKCVLTVHATCGTCKCVLQYVQHLCPDSTCNMLAYMACVGMLATASYSCSVDVMCSYSPHI
jgi:succinate dehydrogenase hydrophobic anchor subunit